MGDWFQTVVDRDVDEGEARASAAEVLAWLVGEGILAEPDDPAATAYAPGPRYELAVDRPDPAFPERAWNSVDVHTTRRVFHSGQGGSVLVCRRCGARTHETNSAWSDAIAEWYEGEGPGLYACAGCGHGEPVTEWTFDPPWGFGCLGFEFWNWPPLRDAFVAEIGRRLGHRVLLVVGKL